MKVLEHGKFYQENRIIDCICGCKYEYEQEDILTNLSLGYLTNPPQYKRYIECPECGARTEIGTTYKYGQTVKLTGLED